MAEGQRVSFAAKSVERGLYRGGVEVDDSGKMSSCQIPGQQLASTVPVGPRRRWKYLESLLTDEPAITARLWLFESLQ